MSRIKKDLHLARSFDELDVLTKIPNLEEKPAIQYEH